MATLAEIRQKLLDAANQQQPRQSQDESLFPHWNIPENSTTTIRFLPDGNPNAEYFWQEQLTIRLPFNGVKGDPSAKNVVVKVPCMEMWKGETCPILSEIRPWFNMGEELSAKARTYWKKRAYIFQGYVVDTQLKEEGKDENSNPIRRFVLSAQLFNLVKNALLDPEIDELPTDYDLGLDFKISKTSKGGYADYGTSTWARKTRALSSLERDALNTHGLTDLSTYLPKKPTDVELKVISEMFEASVNGEAYDFEKWGRYFKPAGYNAPKNSQSTSSDSNNDEDVDLPFNKTQPTEELRVQSKEDNASKANEILAAILNRKNQQ